MLENTHNVLIISEESEVRKALKNAVHLSGYNVATTMMDNTVHALRECAINKYDCIFLDRDLAANSFIRFIDHLFELDVKAAVCMMIKNDQQDLVEEAFFHGALEIISKSSISIRNVTRCIEQSLKYRAKDASNI